MPRFPGLIQPDRTATLSYYNFFATTFRKSTSHQGAKFYFIKRGLLILSVHIFEHIMTNAVYDSKGTVYSRLR